MSKAHVMDSEYGMNEAHATDHSRVLAEAAENSSLAPQAREHVAHL